MKTFSTETSPSYINYWTIQLPGIWKRARRDWKRLEIRRNNRSDKRRFSEFRNFRFICSNRSSRTWQDSHPDWKWKPWPVWYLTFRELLLQQRWWRSVRYRRKSNLKYVWNNWRCRLTVEKLQRNYRYSLLIFN